MDIQDDLETTTTEWASEEAAEQGVAAHVTIPTGTALGRYVIIEPIGQGGMGTVYRAFDPELNRGIALKILSVKQVDSQAAARAKNRLIREAQALAQLSHPNVVAVHDVGTLDDDVFIAMELVRGKTLKEWMEDEKQSVKDTVAVLTDAGQGLSAAHKAGLVHRDFKPGNVIVGDDGRVRVLDFGLARVVDGEETTDDRPVDTDSGVISSNESSSGSSASFGDTNRIDLSSSSTSNLLLSPLTNVGGVLGTPMYMAPEQHLGRKTDERTDQHAFCLVLYEALFGRRPFRGKTLESLKKRVLAQKYDPPPANSPVPDKGFPFPLKRWSLL